MKLKNKLKIYKQKRQDKKFAKQEANDHIPRITNETIASNREEVLRGARKYIYPLQHSKHKVVIITTTLFITSILGFATYCVVALYKIDTTSSFIYRVTQVIPFPVARTGKRFVAYENYLFELRHYIHYYETQQKIGFSTESGKQQLDDYKKRSLDKVVNDALIKQIASEKGVAVSDQDLETQIQIARNQNRLGGSTRVFEDVIKEYYGWSLSDFKRSLRSQMLEEKVNASLDSEAKTQLDASMSALASGTSFADVAKQYSDDEISKAIGGDFGVIDKSNTAVLAHTIDTLFKLKQGEVADPIIISYGTGYAYEIIKSTEVSGEKVKGSHIIIALKDINSFLNDKKDKQPTRRYISP